MPLRVNRFQPSLDAGVRAGDDRSRMVGRVLGDACGVARVRGEFAGWLQRHFSLDAQRRTEVVLAVNEALTNAVEFGCPYGMGQARVVCAAVYDDDTGILSVTVSDGGRWRLVATTAPTPGHCPQRGRGVPLMRVLTDGLQIDTSERGTQVSLVWADLR
jgi:serine/threonine-protein kinase RsbW